MSSWRVLAGFGAGFVVAGAVAGLARVAGLDEPPAAIADVEAPAAASAPRATAAEAAAGPEAAGATAAAPEAPAPARKAKPSRRWRAPHKTADDVPAGVIARVASRRGVERARCARAEAKDVPDGVARAMPADEPCADDAGRVDSVEIDWHGPAPKP